MIETTILTEEIIKNICLRDYKISDIISIQLLDVGTASVYVVSSVNKKLILKEYQSKYKEEDIIKEIIVIEYLKKKGLPSTTFIKTINGKYYTSYKGKIIQLQVFIDGHVYENNTAPQWLMRDSVSMLADIHNKLADFREVTLSVWSDLFDYDTITEVNKHKDYLHKAKELPDSENKAIVIKDLQDKIQMMENFDNTVKLNLTLKNSHADYYIGQLICKDNKINAVIDFAKTARIPVTWEIMRSFTQSDPYSKDGDININNLKTYIRHYLSRASLSKDDLGNMLYIYLKQLIKSDYGYKAFVLQQGSGIEKLLRFGIWRSNITRWLYNNWVETSKELKDLA